MDLDKTEAKYETLKKTKQQSHLFMQTINKSLTCLGVLLSFSARYFSQGKKYILISFYSTFTLMSNDLKENRTEAAQVVLPTWMN